MKKRLFWIVLTLLLLTTCGKAGEVSLAWDASTSSGVTGYNLYYGTSHGTYPTKVDAKDVLAFTVTGLTVGTNYCFVATAYDAEGNESGYSNEACGVATRTERILAAPVLRIPTP